MANKFALTAWAEPLREVAFGSVTGTLAAIGTPYVHPVRVFCLTNGTDAVMYWSWNKDAPMGALLPGNSFVLDITTNKSFPDGLYLKEGCSTYIKYQSAPSIGSVYLSLI